MVENTELKEYMINLTKTELQKFKLLSEIYSERRISKILNKNIKKVFSDETLINEAGYYNTGTNEIHLKVNEEHRITQTEVENTYTLKGTVMHECIHALFCHEEYSTGALAKYGNRQIGRGINEGLTNWIIEKCGIIINGYLVQKNIVKALECVFDEETILKLLSGKTNKSFKALGLSTLEGEIFFSKVDEITALKEEIRNKKGIIYNLEKLLEQKTVDEEVAKQQLVRSKHNYNEKMTLRDNMEEVKSSNVEDLMDYYSTLDNEIVSIIDILINKYAEPLLEQERNKNKLDEESYLKLSNLYIRIWNMLDYIEDTSKRKIASLKIFEEEFKKVSDNLFNELLQGEVSVQNLENKIYLSSIINRPLILINSDEEEITVKKKQVYQKALGINFEGAEEKFVLLEYLRKEKKLKSLEKYFISDLNNGSYIISGNEEKPVVVNTEILKNKKHKYSEKEFSEAMKNFNIMREKVEENSEIEVLDINSALISVKEQDKNRIYMLNNKSLIFEEIFPKRKVNIELPPKKELPAQIPLKQNWWARIRNKILEKEPALIYEDEVQNTSKEFIEKIKVDNINDKEISENVVKEKRRIDRTI